MKRLPIDRWFVWTMAGVIVLGISLWGYIEYTIVQMDTEAAVIDLAYQPPHHAAPKTH